MQVKLEYIKNLDLSRYELGLQKPVAEGGLAMTPEETQEAAKRYKFYLYLVLTYPDQPIEVNYLQDQMWHQHILDTKTYMKDCDFIFGKYLHHDPFPANSITEIDHKIKWRNVFEDFNANKLDRK